MPKVSVVIPVFGVEKFIERCARSLFEQTLDDLEYIFVDDCTNHKSIAILSNVLKDYPNRIPQTKILHHEVNKGLPTARKTGISIATGEYVAHCDSDDWMEATMYQEMYESAKKNGADMVVTDFVIDGNGTQLKSKGLVSKNNDKISDFILRRNKCCIWNKMFSTSLFHNASIKFPLGNMGEDMALVLQVLPICKNIEYIPRAYYHYSLNDQSITQVKDPESVVSQYKQLKANVDLIIDYYKQKNLYIKYSQEFVSLKFHVKSRLQYLISDKTIYEMWCNTYSEINLRVLYNPYIAFMTKIKYSLKTLCYYFK